MEDHNDPAPNGAVAIDGSSDEEGYSSPPDDSDDDELANLRPCTYTLGISRYYSPNWTRQDAFREYYQNWKDAIIASYDLEPRNFKPELKETGDQIQITVHRPHPSGPRNSSMELLGYIRFRKKAGCVELANFKAQLNMEHLLLGRTTKRGHDRFAGHHGEGFKIASLVMRRNEHAVRYAASSYYWNFRFRRRSPTLSCILSRANPEVLQRKKEAFSTRVAAGARRGLTSNIWEDVIVRISKARGECGSKVTEADFRSWLDVTLDINRPPPSDFIETCYGDMILDARFSGQIYLKGLRVPGDGGDGRVYIFGYNFHRGQIDRDRRKLGNAQEETRMIANIWEQAMIARGDEVVDSYIKLFRDHEHSLDINLADRTVSRSAAQAIWNRLRTSFPDAFFYPEKVSSDFGRVDQGETIVRNLKKQPQSLPAALWRLLRTYSLARTPLEETIHLFSNSTAVAITQDMFALNILRCLKASMLLNQTLKDIRFEVVTGGNTEVNILFKPEQNVILIHQKWTGFRKVHTFSNCDAFSMIRNEAPNPRAFYCDHVVEDLFELALNTIRGVLKLSQQDCMTLRRAARKLVQQMPRLVRISQNAAPMELEVSWTGNEGGLVSKTCAASINYNVILHKKSTCWPLFSDILLHLHAGPENNPDPGYSSNPGQAGAPCSCVRQVVSHIESKAIFRGLDHEEEYFPMVSRVENGSLFGVPPPPIAPNGAIGNHEPSTTLMEFPVLNSTTRTRTPSPESRTGDSSLPIASDGFEDINEVDDNANQSHGNTHTTAVNTSRRRIRAQAGLRQGSHRTDMVHQDAYEKDEKTWETWQEKELPDTFARLTPKRGMNNLQCTFSVPSLECPYLDFTFERHEYAHIRLESGVPNEYVIYIHDIRSKEPISDKTSHHLQARKYSFLRSAHIFQPEYFSADGEMPISERELLLHFSDFGRMADESDAETIRLDNITYAAFLPSSFEGASDSVNHAVQLPQDLDNCDLFCRFAICRSTASNVSCINPISSNLVQRRERPRRLNFDFDQSPLVFDLTASVLGPSEGFSQSNFTIHSGTGCEHDKSVTWKMRYPSSQLYDGSTLEVLEDFKSGNLQQPFLPNSELPRVALVAGEFTPFRFSHENQQMPSLAQFLKPFDIIDAATSSTLAPHFLVMIMPAAILHRSAIGRLSASIFKLLKRRFSINIKLSPLQEHNIPQKSSTVIVVAAPFATTLPWNLEWPPSISRPPIKIKDFIEDISFKNPRASQGTKSGFVCSIPVQSNPEENPGHAQSQYLYNHQTGRLPTTLTTVGERVNMDATFVSLSPYKVKLLVHPTRGDRFTVREIARLQGFKDDFVFYNSEESQYMAVLRAVPPIVAQKVAGTIFRAIKGMQVMRLGDSNGNPMANKRPRLEDHSFTSS